MSPEPQEPNSGNATAELAFVQQALAAADRSERSSRIVVAVLAILPFVTFIWMHLHLFPPENLGQILHSLLRVDLFFLVLLFAITVPAHGWLHHKSPRNLLKFEAWRRNSLEFCVSAKSKSVRIVSSPSVHRDYRASAMRFRGPRARFQAHCSAEPFRGLSEESGKSDQVVRGATEDKQPVHLLQSAQLDLAQRAGLLQPPEALFDQPSATQADRVARLPRGSAVQIAAAALCRSWPHAGSH